MLNNTKETSKYITRPKAQTTKCWYCNRRYNFHDARTLDYINVICPYCGQMKININNISNGPK